MDDATAGPNPYDVLELPHPGPAGPSEADVRRAFRRLALVKHPDKQPDNPHAAAEFAAIQKAYEVLTDADARGAWDDLLRARAARVARDAARGCYRGGALCNA